MYLYKFRKYIEKNSVWVGNCINRYFKTNLEIKCLMCHFMREFLNFYKREEGQFNPFPSDPWADVYIFLLFKNLFVKYQYNVLHIDHYVTYNDFRVFF